MSAQSINREVLRTNILQTAADSAPKGVTIPLVRVYARAGGFRSVTEEEVEAGIQYLVDKGFLALVPKSISPENKAWRVTADGQDFLALEGLA